MSMRHLVCVTLLLGSAAAQPPSLGVTSLDPGCLASLTLQGGPGDAFILAADTALGPVVVPGVGFVDLALGPNLVILADTGSLGVTLDAQGSFELRFRVPWSAPQTLPSPVIYAQAVTVGPGGPAVSNFVSAVVNPGSGPAFAGSPSTIPAEALLAEGCVFGDLDGDGDLDLVIANNGFGTSRILINQGGAQGGIPGTYQDETLARLGGPAIGALCVAAEDIDGDGDLDIFLGADDLAGNAPNVLYLNQGGLQLGVEGMFVADLVFPGGSFETQAALFIDVDQDGDLDLVCGNGVDVSTTPEPNELFINTGGVFTLDPVFAAAPFNASGGETDGVVKGDIDGDVVPDLVIVRDGVSQVLLNDGTGRFQEITGSLPPGPSNATAGVMADFNRDGHQDLFIANIGAPDRLSFGDGTGMFTSAPLPFAPTAVIHLDAAAGDLDGDGDIDIMVAVHTLGGGERSFVYLNQGGHQGGTVGTFQAVILTSSPADVVAAVALGDVDSDGDLDIYIGSQGFIGPMAQDVLLLNGACP